MFEGLLLHETSRRQLESFIKQPPHAVLICGEEHLGKYTCARLFAATLLGISQEDLGKSSAYREVSSIKGVIPIESVRALLPFFALTMPGKQWVRRIVLIPDAETMTLAAQNSLLKVLEEPPTDVVLILTSSYPDKLLPTVRSRCQICRMQKPSESEVKAYLKEYDADAIDSALIMGGGTVGAAKQLLTEQASLAVDVQAIKGFLGLSLFDQLLSLDTYAKDREMAIDFVSLLVTVAEKGLMNNPSLQWQRILQASLTADAALRKNANVKLVLLELALNLR